MTADDRTPDQNNTTPAQRNPALAPLEVLVGEWEVEFEFPFGPVIIGHAHTSFRWLEDGAFLSMRATGDTPDSPWSLCVIGRDDVTETYSVLYYDWRGTSRIYHMSLEQGLWKQWRDTPEFSQRFSGVLSDDGKTITARWEKSVDGSQWEHDFDLTYTRVG